MENSIKGIILIAFACLHFHSFGQPGMDDIDLERIHHRKIRKYIAGQIEEGRHQFVEIQPSWNSLQDFSSFRKNEMAFYLLGNLNDIWEGYLSANPSLSWKGRNISFGLLLQKFPGTIFYDHDQINGVATGQVYYLNLNLLLGVFNVPVAFEMITVNTREKIIEFSYIEGNKSIGVQQVKFIDFGDDRTEIIHTSYYKSDSGFRDKWIYPFFHKKIVNDFHRNMRRLMNCVSFNIPR